MQTLKPIFFLLSLLASFASLSASVAIVIDDMGNTQRDAQAFQLPTQIAFSILPHTPFSSDFAKRASAQHREIMLHMPMESLSGKRLGPGALTSNMYPEQLNQALSDALQSVPNAIGLNNHMGSKLTQLTLPMTTTMQFLQSEGLFFMDSRTTRFSKAEDIAKDVGVTTLRRNVFLDHHSSNEQIARQFRRLIQHAKHYGSAIGIGHPHPSTIKFLRTNLQRLDKNGIALVKLSELMPSGRIANQKSFSQTRFAASE